MSLSQPDFNSFEATIASLFSRVRGHIEPGAHRLQQLLDPAKLNHLQTIPTVLVSGTNGKGTTCALLEKAFRNTGYRTALYTSPHLICPTERIRIDGKPISRDLFLAAARQAFESARVKLPDATFFELMTALAFEIICTHGVEMLVCEVGLGGRLDSTNVLAPLVSILTSVSLDHTEWLGETQELIAFEKSFISRRNRPFIVGQIEPEAQRGVMRATQITGARVCFLKRDFSSENLTAHADIAFEICSIALTEFNNLKKGPLVSQEALKQAQKNFRWPGRMDHRIVDSTRVILDAAHNAHGVEYFLQKCELPENSAQMPRPWILVYASLADKDWQKCLSKLAPVANAIHLTQTQSSRAVPVKDLLQYTLTVPEAPAARSHACSSEALKNALQDAKERSGTVLVLGSITLVGEAMESFSLPVFTEDELEF
ncbi:hypothetical protein EBU99_00735 [bacterium]|nr:hypothetical protein [bacterium]